MEMTKSEKLLKKRKKNFRGFFSIWRHPRKGVVQGFPNTYFNNFFRAAFKQLEIRHWKFQVNLISSFGDSQCGIGLFERSLESKGIFLANNLHVNFKQVAYKTDKLISWNDNVVPELYVHLSKIPQNFYK